jgi:hypothetical protein
MIANKYPFDFTTLLLHMSGWSACPLGDVIERLFISSKAELWYLLRNRRL